VWAAFQCREIPDSVLQTHNRFGKVAGMDLTQYAIAHGGTGKLSCPVLDQTAARAQCSHRTLYLIAKGHKKAGPHLAARIAVATNYEVPRAVLRPDLWGMGNVSGG
jgi:hypothetical protein